MMELKAIYNRSLVADKASEHTQEMAERYSSDIKKAVRGSRTYGSRAGGCSLTSGMPWITLTAEDSVGALYRYGNGRTCILDFASYLGPGGGFLTGSMAQEEALCHESFLYNVLAGSPKFYLKNRKTNENGLYSDRALYVPNVIFEREGYGPAKSDVLVCAAPNWNAARHNGVTEIENLYAFMKRIKLIIRILRKEGVNTAILGAFGCGAFGQDPNQAADFFYRAIQENLAGMKISIVFAVPDENSRNFRAFAKEFGRAIS